MIKRLPPLNALRFFEAAARYLNFSSAAEELCVTTAAVSHQIRQLEEFLGLALFVRRNNRLSLTPEGDHYAPRVREAFRALAQATDLLLDDNKTVLRVAAPLSFGTKWLVPRLYRFFNAHPDFLVEVVNGDAPDSQNVDLEITTNHHPPIGMHLERFASTCFFPVCSPQWQQHIHTLEDLTQAPLLHVRTPGNTKTAAWKTWLEELDIPDTGKLDDGQVFGDMSLCLQAAIDGQGIALGPRILVEYDIAAGRLIKPLPFESRNTVDYLLAFPPAALENPAFQIFRNWLIAEALH